MRGSSLRFELPEVETENGEACLVFHTVFNLSTRSKKFREMACALMGSNDLTGPVREMLGKACKLTIIHNESADGQVFANIASFKALKPGTPIPQTETEQVFFSLDPKDVPDLKSLQKAFDALPESERTKVAASETWKELLATRKRRSC